MYLGFSWSVVFVTYTMATAARRLRVVVDVNTRTTPALTPMTSTPVNTCNNANNNNKDTSMDRKALMTPSDTPIVCVSTRTSGTNAQLSVPHAMIQMTSSPPSVANSSNLSSAPISASIGKERPVIPPLRLPLDHNGRAIVKPLRLSLQSPKPTKKASQPSLSSTPSFLMPPVVINNASGMAHLASVSGVAFDGGDRYRVPLSHPNDNQGSDHNHIIVAPFSPSPLSHQQQLDGSDRRNLDSNSKENDTPPPQPTALSSSAVTATAAVVAGDVVIVMTPMQYRTTYRRLLFLLAVLVLITALYSYTNVIAAIFLLSPSRIWEQPDPNGETFIWSQVFLWLVNWIFMYYAWVPLRSPPPSRTVVVGGGGPTSGAVIQLNVDGDAAQNSSDNNTSNDSGVDAVDVSMTMTVKPSMPVTWHMPTPSHHHLPAVITPEPPEEDYHHNEDDSGEHESHHNDGFDNHHISYRSDGDISDDDADGHSRPISSSHDDSNNNRPVTAEMSVPPVSRASTPAATTISLILPPFMTTLPVVPTDPSLPWGSIVVPPYQHDDDHIELEHEQSHSHGALSDHNMDISRSVVSPPLHHSLAAMPSSSSFLASPSLSASLSVVAIPSTSLAPLSCLTPPPTPSPLFT
jgi:hypothetical protein